MSDLCHQSHPDQVQLDHLSWYVQCHRDLHAPWVAIDLSMQVLYLQKHIAQVIAHQGMLDRVEGTRSVSYCQGLLCCLLYAYGIRLSSCPSYPEPHPLDVKLSGSDLPWKAILLAEELEMRSGCVLKVLRDGYTWMDSEGINTSHLPVCASELLTVLFLTDKHLGDPLESGFRMVEGSEVHDLRVWIPLHQRITEQTVPFDPREISPELTGLFGIDAIEDLPLAEGIARAQERTRRYLQGIVVEQSGVR